MRTNYKVWTEDETLFLIENYKNMSCLDIGLKIGRTVKSVEKKVIILLKNNRINRKTVPIKIGGRYGRLIVTKESSRRKKDSGRYYVCQCDCGKIIETLAHSLNQEFTRSCGCLAKDRAKEVHRLGIGESVHNRMEGYYKSNAKNKDVPYELSREEFRFLVSQDCYYCGIEPKSKNPFYYEDGSRNKISKDTTEEWTKQQWVSINGIDRKDNSKEIGYTFENCVPCCEYCNRIKLNKTEKEFLEHIEKIHNFQESKKK